jgi:hypothetical protein
MLFGHHSFYQHGFESSNSPSSLLFFREVGHGREGEGESDSAGASEHGTWFPRGRFRVGRLPFSPACSALLCYRTRPPKTCFPPRRTLTFSLLIAGKYLSAQSFPQSSENDSGALNMSPGIGRSVSTLLPATSRTPSSTLLPFKNSGFMQTIILFGPAFRNPYLSQNCSTGT